MPAASHVEKEGTFTNTQRLLQWRDKALDPPGDARSELWFMHHLAKRVQAHYAGSSDPTRLADPQPHLGLPRARRASREPDAEAVLREINGYDVATGAPVPGFARAARTTARPRAAAGSTPASSRTASTRRAGASPATSTPGGWVSPEWGWAWPANRRILYNRASADPDGQAVVGAQEATSGGTRSEGKWTGYDVPGLPGRQARPTTARRRRRARAWTRSPATTRSS